MVSMAHVGSQVYDKNLGNSLQVLWAVARERYLDEQGNPLPVPRWDGRGTFVVDDEICR